MPNLKVQNHFKKRFGPREYLTMYYPQNLDVQRLFEAYQIVQKEYDADGRIHIVKTVVDTGMSSETIENLVILDFQKIVLRYLAQECPKGDGILLEVGGGPTIYQHIALALAVRHIVHSEFLERNREEVHQWIRGDKEAYNWDAYFHLIKMILANDRAYQTLLKRQARATDGNVRTHAKLVQEILRSKNLESYKTRVRHCLKDTTSSGDLFHPNLGWATPVAHKRTLDLVVSNFAVESATNDRAKWEKGMKNIISFIKPGGLLSLVAIRNAAWYQVGNERMPAVSITEKDMEYLCVKEGLTILETRVLIGSPQEEVGYEGMVFMLARKPL